jgi:phosphatidylglycerol---prolipoprotein diacylglyceryl transferase
MPERRVTPRVASWSAVILPAALAPAIIHINIDPVLQVGGLSIHWYGVLYAVAFWVGLRYGVVPFLSKYGISRQESEQMCFWVIIVGLVGARLYYVVQSSPPQGGSWFSHPGEILAVWHGGMAFFGAVIFALPFAVYLAWRRGLNGWLIADAAAIFAVLGQPIGRIGNIINGDILGHASTLPWATAYFNPNAVLQSGFCLSDRPFPTQSGSVTCAANTIYAYQPAAAYEALGTILIGLVLWRLLLRRVPVGTLILVYLELYALSQFVIFFLRGTEPEVALGLKQAQWTALVFGVVVVPALVWVRRRGYLMWGGEPVLVSLEPEAVAAVEVEQEAITAVEPEPEAVPTVEPEPEAVAMVEPEPGAAAEQEPEPVAAPGARAAPRTSASRRPGPKRSRTRR